MGGVCGGGSINFFCAEPRGETTHLDGVGRAAAVSEIVVDDAEDAADIISEEALRMLASTPKRQNAKFGAQGK